MKKNIIDCSSCPAKSRNCGNGKLRGSKYCDDNIDLEDKSLKKLSF